MSLYLQVNIILVIYKSRNYSIYRFLTQLLFLILFTGGSNQVRPNTTTVPLEAPVEPEQQFYDSLLLPGAPAILKTTLK